MKKKYQTRSIHKNSLIALLALSVTLGTTGCAQNTNVPETQAVVERSNISAYGIVKSKNVLEIVLDFPAKIADMSAQEGQRLSKNETIAILNLDDYNLQIQAKAIELQISGKEKSKILSETSLGLANDYNYQKLQDALNLAKTGLAQSEKDLNNAKTLLSTGAISQKEYDQYKLVYDQKLSAKTGLEKDVAQYEKSKKGVSSSVNITELQAAGTSMSLENMKGKLNAAYLMENRIVSPFEEAVVYDIGYETGALVNQTKKVCTLADLKTLSIEADVTEDFIAEVKAGASVEIIPVADRSKTYHGKVTRIADMAKVDNGETLITIEVSIDDNDGFLKPNYNVDLSIAK